MKFTRIPYQITRHMQKRTSHLGTLVNADQYATKLTEKMLIKADLLYCSFGCYFNIKDIV